MSVPRIPEGHHTLTPHITIKNCAAAIEFYKKAFGAEEICRCAPHGDTIMHAELKIGDSHMFLNDEFPDWGVFGPDPERSSPAVLHLYVEDADAAFERAVAAGCEVTAPLMDAFWGDRYGQLKDPYGHRWGIGHQYADVPNDELDERANQWFAENMPKE